MAIDQLDKLSKTSTGDNPGLRRAACNDNIMMMDVHDHQQTVEKETFQNLLR